MVYVIKWTENGEKRKFTVSLLATARILLNRLIIDCKHYDAVIVEYPNRF